MRALVVYESMYGNTHLVADRIADGLRAQYAVSVVTVEEASPELLAQADLIVVGGPTHIRSLSTQLSRKAARDAAARPDGDLVLEPVANAAGLRDWLHALRPAPYVVAAAFDTRVDGPATLTGRASKGIARRLHRLGYRVVTGPESFLVDKQNRLLAGEEERAEAWGGHLATLTSRAALSERS
jgi:hypothetical protein